VIIWLNGNFGAGTTTTAKALVGMLPNARIFDSEQVGHMLSHVLGEPAADFQDWPPWRDLVVRTAARLLDYVGGTLVIPQSVHLERYWRELRAGFDREGVDLRAFVLHAEAEELARRAVTADETHNRQWRLDHIDAYLAALPWLRHDAEVVDTTGVMPNEVARMIAARVSG
jgi:hypothetical protein